MVESMKQRNLIISLMTVIKEEIPEVYQAMIGERDRFMAESISQCRGKQIVGIVGMAHMDGIEKTLVNEKGFKIVKRNCPSS